MIRILQIPLLCASTRALFGAVVACGLASAVGAAVVEPDYFGIEIPPNIAPLNLDVTGAERVRATMRAADGDSLAADGPEIRWPAKKWSAFLARHAGESYELSLELDGKSAGVATNRISRFPIDSHLTYRLIRPGYSDFGIVGIWQRNLTAFAERPLYRNVQHAQKQCVNCHTYNASDPKTYLFHSRLERHGTQIVSPKYGRIRRDIRLPNGLACTYPAWHPSGDFIAFSANETFQVFYEVSPERIEVADIRSDLLFYSLADDRVIPVETESHFLESFPAWDPAGLRLFTSRARLAPDDVRRREAGEFRDGNHVAFASITNLHYDLVVRTFDPERRTFSEPQILVDGIKSKRSVTFPRVSPDGRWLVMTVGPCGVFHIWHKSADLWILDLQKGTTRSLDELNGPNADSYHCFSKNGRWMVFSSRRDDGAYTRPYFAAFDPETGRFSKPFLLPVENPSEHGRRMLSYNVPEFSAGAVEESPRDLHRLILAPTEKK